MSLKETSVRGVRIKCFKRTLEQRRKHTGCKKSRVYQLKQYYNKYNYVIEVINSKNKLLLVVVF